MLQGVRVPEPKPRKEWQKPAVRRSSAGSAEAGGTTTTDGAFAYS